MKSKAQDLITINMQLRESNQKINEKHLPIGR